jgi:hypothetical protein
MPHKVNLTRRHHFKKVKCRQTEHAEYNNALRNRGRVDIWLSDGILAFWQNKTRIYDGTGSSEKYPDSTIEACHYLRMVFKLPLRQTLGFITNILNMMGYPHLDCPDYSLLSKRLNKLGLNTPKFKMQKNTQSNDIAVAIDSTGLKVFGKDEWHQEKHKVNAKRT